MKQNIRHDRTDKKWRNYFISIISVPVCKAVCMIIFSHICLTSLLVLVNVRNFLNNTAYYLGFDRQYMVISRPHADKG